ncbi:hypothetical protein EOD39_14383 [Acipenser ruthenus]|uniref:HAT C-terminal dimerisation domain-containing protein n=1 Tax=Acipenser ruthenus TaxID=7906 RepID=A0A444UG26_ACIRT|nr:hypothetical protein EOD39_14383 [Acipenser ruthenus]
MDRLLRKFLVKFILKKHIQEQDLQKINLVDRDLQHDDDTISVGATARTYLHEAELISPEMQNTFFSDVGAFYTAVVQKMLDKFPFGDPVLPDLVVLDPLKKVDIDYVPIVRLAGRFAPTVDTELLKEEWEDFQLLPDTDVSMTDDKGQHKSLDSFWAKVINMKTSLDVPRFPEMARVYAALLSLPHSNADCERAFSLVRKSQTEFRKSMLPDTLTAFLKCKINCDGPSFKLKVTAAILENSQESYK